jgi:acetyl esterase/lipase
MRAAGLLWAALAVCLSGCAGVAPPPQAARAAPAARPSETIRLWPGAPPAAGAPEAGPERIGNEGAATGAYSNVQLPRMDVYRPARPNGTAVLVIGGGGYFRIQIGSAAAPIARWLQGEGVTAFVLYYRLPGDGWLPIVPFQDAQRAMRLIRGQAERFSIDPARIGVIGSSAGGHLGGMLATRGTVDFYPPADALDRVPATPNFAGLLYPVISMRPPIDTTRSRRELGAQPDFLEAYSVESHVGPPTPPIFLAHSADDPIADVRHSLWMFEAMRSAGRPAELHVFTTGGHSWGLGAPGSPVSAWQRLFLRWLEQQGFGGPVAQP